MAFRVLSIDGGGMRGIYTAAYLEALENAFSARRGCAQGLDVGKAFQLIVGTSTGALVGCGLAKGVRPAEMVRLYREHGAKIFPRKLPSRLNVDLVAQIISRKRYLKQGDAALRQALIDIFEETTIGRLWEERGIALAIPAVDMSTYRAWVFKTPHDPKTTHRDDLYTLVDICLASSAAPLFRSLAAVDHAGGGGCDIFADGGLWANNPVMVALIEALRMVGGRDDEIEVFALGSCGKPEGEVMTKDAVHRGLLDWKFGGEAAKLSIAAQEFAFDMVAKLIVPHLKRPVRIIRFPSEKIPGAMLEYLDLDETRPVALEALTGQARRDANMTNSGIQQGTPEGRMIEALFNDMPLRGEG